MACTKAINKRGGKKMAIDIIVIRLNSKGALKNSKPCEKCLEHLQLLMLTFRNIRVKNIYYSTSVGIVRKGFNQLIEEEKYVSNGFKKYKSS